MRKNREYHYENSRAAKKVLTFQISTLRFKSYVAAGDTGDRLPIHDPCKLIS